MEVFRLEDACNRTLETAEHSKAAQAKNELVHCLEAWTGYLGDRVGKNSWWQLLTVPIAAETLGWNVFMCLFLPFGHET